MIGVNIDWDFFFKEDPMWDWGHREALIFLHAMWDLRFQTHWCSPRLDGSRDLQKVYAPNPLYKTFWKELEGIGFDFKNTICLYAESNLGAWYAFHILKGKSHIYNFDAHHDIAYGKLGEDVQCGNWLGQLLKSKRSLSATVVYPNAERENEEFRFPVTGDSDAPTDLLIGRWLTDGRLHAKSFYALDGGLGKVNVVFICRSGSWTPPWADEQFVEFVKSFPGRAIYLKSALPNAVDLADPMKPRAWNRKEAIRQAKELSILMARK